VDPDPHHFCNLDPHPYLHKKNLDPHLDSHQSDKLHSEPVLHQFADVKQNCMEFEPIFALFQGFETLFVS
jgi:hypothetical protein